MGNLFASLLNTTTALRVFERSLSTIQNNVTNATTPGYAKQVQTLVAKTFQPQYGLAGGVAAGELLSSRNVFAEQTVRRQVQTWGRQQQRAAGLDRIEPIFDIAAGSGVADALNKLFQAFSALGVSPNDGSARQVVVDRARELSHRFQETATGLQEASSVAGRELTAIGNAINRLSSQIRDLNVNRRNSLSPGEDAGRDATMHALLEELAEYADVTVLEQQDGTVQVLLGGQTPLVLGDKLFELQVDAAGPQSRILNSLGEDISSHVSEGRLKGALEFRDVYIPRFLADLNYLAGEVADRVNGALRNGLALDGNPPDVDLFTYNPALGAAATLSVTNITTDQIAAAAQGLPGGNGNALSVALLGSSRELGGMTFAQYYGKIAADVGRAVTESRGNADTQEQMLIQTRSMRDEISGVSLDEEAVRLIQFQRSYQATSRLMKVLDELTQEVFRMI